MDFTWERYDPEHDAQFFPTVTTAHWARYRWAARYCAGKRVADVACGVGYGTNYLSGFADSITGIDRDAQAIEHCRKNYPDCEFLWTDATNFWLEEPVDVIVSMETIEHLDAPDLFLGCVRDNLKPGGLFLCTTPIRGVKTIARHHKKEFDEGELRGLLEDYFEQVDVSHQSMAWQIEGEFFEVTPVYLVAVCEKAG
jgi:2-polyprenyl-3-methyl-5-hydroxy-6-metoxy-1,4-benzoquinol methylase